MRIAICDDDTTHLGILENAIQNCVDLRDDELVIDSYSSGTDLLRAVNDGYLFTFIFLDIEMPEVTGFDIYSHLSAEDTSIIFVSSHIELLPEAFVLKPYGFIPKPYTQDVFDRTIKSVLVQRAETQLFSFSSNGVEYRIPCNEILYIAVEGHYLFIHTINTKKSCTESR